MMIQVLQTPRFAKQLKKLKVNQKKDLDGAVQNIINDPLLGVQKRGDLDYIRVYKFNMSKQQTLLAYGYDDGRLIIELLGVGSDENFYRDLKR